MAAEYDFSKATRGVTARRYAAESNIVVLDLDVALVFRDASTVNRALRLLARLAQSVSVEAGPRGRRRSRKR
jgi:hypothetical protein